MSNKLPIPVDEFASWPFISQAMNSPLDPMSVLSFFFGVDCMNVDNHIRNDRISMDSFVQSKLGYQSSEHIMKVSRLWFRGGPAYDEMCMCFKDTIRLLVNYHNQTHCLSTQPPSMNKESIFCHDRWNDSVHGKMAQQILFDQLARNIFRGSGEAYAFEHISLKIAKELGRAALDGSLSLLPIYAFVTGITIQHSESLHDQYLAIDLIDWGDREQGEGGLIKFQFQRRWNVDHKNVLERFGRYPHRNSALGRVSTQEEIEYLNDVDNLAAW
eukprot:CAMPEP_0116064508 /NCGR_PEP_ID=MMETSP0322-20121206/9150_1 /TAXON_ID=163516 /ORGANISM="Leptocylindrus danicus var. apora, Strain B651" /LENGTH=270 /DNA_ID=CAMNT_0003550527 /DNA_START=38 /DNA_END=847 /DNA_ORIENTATION=+